MHCFSLHILVHSKELDTFSYQDSDINEIILSCMSNVSMTGITGSIQFEEGADPVKNVHIERIQGISYKLSV